MILMRKLLTKESEFSEYKTCFSFFYDIINGKDGDGYVN